MSRSGIKFCYVIAQQGPDLVLEWKLHFENESFMYDGEKEIGNEGL